MSRPVNKAQGFTLIEVLLALMIFATLSVAATQIFRNVIASDQQTEQIGDALKNMQRTLIIMDSDFRQMLARQYRNGGDESEENLLEFGDDLLDSESQGIRFVRGGWINPQQLFPRGEVVKVGYRIQDEKLERIRWMYPDDSSATEPAVMPLMEGVTSLRFEVKGENGWQKDWDDPLAMPKAIRVLMDTERYGQLSRVYLLPGQTLPGAAQETP